MLTIEIPFTGALCLAPDTPEERLRLGKDALLVRTRDGDMLLDRARLDIVRPYSGERVYNATVRFVAFARQDQAALAHRGFTPPWLEDFCANRDSFHAQMDEEIEADEAEAATRLFSVASGLPGAQVARHVLTLAQGHWVEELLGVSLSSLQTIEGLHAGIRRMNGRLRNPLVEERVLGIGVSKEELVQMRQAQDALHRMIDETRMAAAVVSAGPSNLLVARAILWAEMTLFGAAARAELPEERWRLYQAPSLLELPPRGPDRRDRPAEGEPPGAQPGGGATGATGSTATTGATGTGRPGLAVQPTAAGTLSGGAPTTGGATGAHATQPGTAPAVTTGTTPGATAPTPTAGTPGWTGAGAPAGTASSAGAPTTGTGWTAAGAPAGTAGATGAPVPGATTETSAPSPGAAATPTGPALPAGTPLYAVPPGGGDPMPVVLLPDGTLAWGAPASAVRKGQPAAAARTPKPRKTRR